jgi:UDP-GlcNAc:undecaprenyl-phosphate GlcNAc-1-phosphate transferase
MLALGIPLFDTILSPLRRFVRGREMFSPDKGHFHHRLLDMGLTTKRAVLIIYVMTFALCLSAVILVNIRDEQAGLFLVVLGAGAVLFTRKLGYFEYIASDKVYGWFRDFADDTGLSRDRRSFLSLQIDMNKSTRFDNLWEIFCRAVEMLEFDLLELELDQNLNFLEEGGRNQFKWRRNNFYEVGNVDINYLLRLDFPLLNTELKSYGTLRLVKDLKRNPVSHYTFRRVEQLRGSFMAALESIAERNASS